MQRRSFLKKTGLGLAASAAAVAAPAVHAGEPKVKWRMTSSFPKSLSILYSTAELLANRLREITDGNFDIRVFPAGKIVPAMGALDAVERGTVDMCHTCSYYYTDKNKAFALGTSIPFGMNARQFDSWVTEGGGQKLLDEFYADWNVYSFLGGNTGVQMGGWFRNRIETVRDLHGLKMRIAGLGGDVMQQLGVVPLQLPASALYSALEKGIIDAVEWIAPHDDEKLAFHKLVKHYYAPGWWEPGPAVHFYVNRLQWNKLPKSYQAAFRSAAREAHIYMYSLYNRRNPEALSRLLQAGVHLETFSQDVMKRAWEAAMDLYADERRKNSAWAKIYPEYNRYLRLISAWFCISEYPYDRFIYSMR